jgi:Ca-activated chloride channel homolog
MNLLRSFLLCLLLCPVLVAGQTRGVPETTGFEEPLSRVLFIFDASNSMYGLWQSDRKINIAKKLLSNLLDSLSGTPNVEFALRVYGHQSGFPPQDCSDTRLEIPFGPDNTDRIKRKLNALVPKGTTPIAMSLEQCVDDFPGCRDCRNVVVLITDGIEECQGDPCEVSRRMQQKGIILRPFIIGIGSDFSADFACVGNYYDASSEQAFRRALNVVVTQAINTTTLQVNLLDQGGKPTETNVNMTFYDQHTGRMHHNFIHTMNARGVPDTLVLDHNILYRIVVHTIPPVTKDSVRLTPGRHNIIAIDAPQGDLVLKVGGRDNLYKDLVGVVRKPDAPTTLHVQSFGSTERYITGEYELEVLCLPRLIIKDVLISQFRTTEVVIPVPGIAVISKPARGFGSLYIDYGNRLEWVINLNNEAQQESLVLQPGHYRIVFRSRFAHRTFQTLEQSFEITSGSTQRVNIRN